MIKKGQLSKNCWLAVICESTLHSIFNIDCTTVQSPQIECPPLFFFPSSSVLFHGISYLFESHKIDLLQARYVCFDKKKCSVDFLQSISMNDSACIIITGKEMHDPLHASRKIRLLFQQLCSIPNLLMTNDTNCSHSSLYYCENTTRCISKHRLQDRSIDCYKSDDELFHGSCSLNFSHRFYCASDNKCIPQLHVGDNQNDCTAGEDELIVNSDSCLLNSKCVNHEELMFSKICDGFTDMSPVEIDHQNGTDETNCQYWPCHTHYTHCDGIWNCPNGADELNCSTTLYPYQCNSNEHHCLIVNHTIKTCPPDENGKYDCLTPV
jgi:hypothetical protein